MEQRRVTRMKRTVIFNDVDEEDGRGEGSDKDRSRNIILRIKKTKYTEDDEDDDDEDMEEDEQPGPSTQNTHSHKAHKSKLLDVTCGNKSGYMDVEKLQRGEDCIRYKNKWFSPPAFEELGGKGSSKKWKATILHKDKPLQFLFEQGHLTTTGYKRRSNGIPKPMQTPPSPPTSGSSSEGSEAQLEEESEPDDANDDDWHPKSHELEGAAPESLAFSELTDSGADTSKEEVDTVIETELDSEEDEDLAAVAGNIKTVGEWEALKKSAQQKEARVFIKRLLKANTDSQCNHKECPQEESEPLNERRQNEEDMEHNSSSIAYNTEDKTRESSLRDEGRRREITTKIENSPTPAAATSSDDTKDIRSIGSQTLRALKTEEITDTVAGDSSTESQELVECERDNNTSATTSGTEDAQLQLMNMESMAPETNQLPDVAQSPDTMEAPALDTMDLDQLRREKIKIQIRVLKLQEEYFTKILNRAVILNRPEKVSNL